MKETFYFPHDYSAINDPKMMILLNECGLAGIGMYWIIIEILHQEPTGKISREAYKSYIHLYGRIDGENEHLLNKIEQMLITVGLLNEQNNCVESKRVNENKNFRKSLSEKRSKAGKISAKKRLSVVSTSVQQVSTSVQQGKERKGKEKVIDIVADATEKEFDFVSYRTAMLNNANPAIKIIAGYWMIKGFTFTNAKQTAVALKRELIPANSLTGYELKKIGDTMRWLQKNADFKWTLESVGKYINEDLENLEKLKDKNHYKCKKGLWHKTGQPCGH